MKAKPKIWTAHAGLPVTIFYCPAERKTSGKVVRVVQAGVATEHLAVEFSQVSGRLTFEQPKGRLWLREPQRVFVATAGFVIEALK